ncbi:MAG: DUF3015 domain-containing protein [Deferribacteraceae bacterium]|jgi:hypothetical protein|nr:DUF3015 domain-containing protein [Deferribacteraceae bacterium]
MKKLLVVLTLFVFASVASANQSNTGCGLGAMLLGDSADSKLMQILVTTTNGTFTTQSWGITLDIAAFKCSSTSAWVANETVGEFVQGNMDSLVRDVAMGSGETITTLASIMEVQDVDAFGSKLQKNFAVIFPSADVEFAYVADAITIVNTSL